MEMSLGGMQIKRNTLAVITLIISPALALFLSSALESSLCTTAHLPLLLQHTQPCAGETAVHWHSSSHQNEITTVLILSVSNSGRSLCKLKSLLSDNISEET